MKNNWKKYVAAFLLVSCMLMMMFGCTNKENESSSNPETAVETLKIGMLGLDIKTACIILAQKLGYFKEEGVNVEFENISNLGDGVTALDQGKLDILPFGIIPTCTFLSQGSDLYIIAGTISEGSEIIVTPENANSIHSAEDFIGKNWVPRMETATW